LPLQFYPNVEQVHTHPPFVKRRIGQPLVDFGGQRLDLGPLSLGHLALSQVGLQRILLGHQSLALAPRRRSFASGNRSVSD
jgi:hypothetical protein